jgi:hypothetical protein
MTKKEAVAYCERRWREQCDRFPTMRDDIPLALYVSRNLRATMRLPADVPPGHPGHCYRVA